RPLLVFCFMHAPPTPEIYTLSLHDALPIYGAVLQDHAHLVGLLVRRGGGHVAGRHGLGADERAARAGRAGTVGDQLDESGGAARSEEHTSELQSPCNLVCRLLLEKKKYNKK